jgi:4a-hydroxytetrahydrobiopterin dehydratase
MAGIGVMRPTLLPDDELSRFLSERAGWKRDGQTLRRVYTFDDYGKGIGFAVAVGVAAEKKDHHPDLFIGWRKVEVRWSTHDAGGITALDVEMATLCDQLHAR